MGRDINAYLDVAKIDRCYKMTLVEVATTITAAATLVGIGIGVGKVLLDISFLKREFTALKREVAEIKHRLTVLEKEQLEMKLILKQIAKKLRIGY